MFPYLSTANGVTVLVLNRPHHIAKDNNIYSEIMNAINRNASDTEVLEILNRVKKQVETACILSGNIQYNQGHVTYKGETLKGYAIGKLISLIEDKKDTTALTNFLEKLYKNPSNQTIDNLYGFLEYGKIPINKDGNFIAYKAVNKDYKDIFTGKFDNQIGSVLSMPRRNVNDNREVTCSHGFHVCSYEYLPHFAHVNDGHIMICEVDPENVVSIPKDYNNTKMRVCSYKVIGEDKEWKPKDSIDILAQKETWDEEYELYVDNEYVESYDSLEEAIKDSKDFTDRIEIYNINGILVHTDFRK